MEMLYRSKLTSCLQGHILVYRGVDPLSITSAKQQGQNTLLSLKTPTFIVPPTPVEGLPLGHTSLALSLFDIDLRDLSSLGVLPLHIEIWEHFAKGKSSEKA